MKAFHLLAVVTGAGATSVLLKLVEKLAAHTVEVRQAQGPVCAQPLRKATRGTEVPAALVDAARPAAREERVVRIMEADMVLVITGAAAERRLL